jgi:low temperature requirement protein LtrA
MVAGIIVSAAADDIVISHPNQTSDARVTSLILGGTALILLGHAAFKAAVWRIVPWARLMAVIVLAGLDSLSGHVSQLTMAVLAGVVAVLVAASDRVIAAPRSERSSGSS